MDDDVKDRYDIANDITHLVKLSIEPLEELKYLSETLKILWMQHHTLEDIKFKQNGLPPFHTSHLSEKVDENGVDWRI